MRQKICKSLSCFCEKTLSIMTKYGGGDLGFATTVHGDEDTSTQAIHLFKLGYHQYQHNHSVIRRKASATSAAGAKLK